MPDARGHGVSDKPHERPAYAWDVRVSDIEAVMDDLDVESAHIWGYSMGGVYAFALVRRAPARVRTAIIGGAHPYAASWSAFHGLDGTNPSAFLAALESFVGVLPPEVRARVLNNDFQALAAAAGDRESMEDVFAAITMPCLLYVGADDPRDALVKAAAKSIAGSDFAVLERCDHVQTNLRSDLVLPHVNEFLKAASQREAR